MILRWIFLISNFRRVLSILCFLLGISPASAISESTFSCINTPAVLSSSHISYHLPMKMEQVEYSETSAYIILTPGNYPKENNIFRILREFEIKNTSPPWGGNRKTRFIPPAYEHGTDRVFRNVGIYNSDAGELPKKYIIYSEHGESFLQLITKDSLMSFRKRP